MFHVVKDGQTVQRCEDIRNAELTASALKGKIIELTTFETWHELYVEGSFVGDFPSYEEAQQRGESLCAAS